MAKSKRAGKRRPIVWASANRKKRRRLHGIDNRCRYCLVPMTLAEATLDHIVPMSKGGLRFGDNVTLACEDCQQRKGDSMPVGEWAPKFRP